MKPIADSIVLGLPDLCSDLISFSLELRKTKDPGDAETLRHGIDGLLRDLESRAREHGIAESDVALVKYALVALLDEMILTSSWPAKEVWSGNPLQLEYFNDFAAGEEFFNKLESLRRFQDPAKVGVLEVYYLCLTLGFRGKYGDLAGMEKLKTLVKDVAEEILRARERDPSTGGDLSPASEPPDQLPQIVRQFPIWGLITAGAGVILLVFLLLSALLGRVTSGVLETLE